MLRAAATLLLLLWVIGSVSGYAFGGSIHLLLLAASVLLLVQHRIEANNAAGQEVSPAGILSIVLRRAQEDPGQTAHDRWSVPPR